MRQVTKEQYAQNIKNSKVFAKNKSNELINKLYDAGFTFDAQGEPGSPFFVINDKTFTQVSLQDFYTLEAREYTVESVLDYEIYAPVDIVPGEIYVVDTDGTRRAFVADSVKYNVAYSRIGKDSSGWLYYGKRPWSDMKYVRKANAAEKSKFIKTLKDNGFSADGIKIRDGVYYATSYNYVKKSWEILTLTDEGSTIDDYLYNSGNYFKTEEAAKKACGL